MPRIVRISTASPIDTGALKEPQTSRVASLANEYLTGQLDGLSPSRVASILRQADNGDLWAQHRLIRRHGRARRAPLCRDRQAQAGALVPGLDDRAAAQRQRRREGHAEWLTEVLTDAADPFEELLVLP
jgi:phage gp29-like protein